ncbi:MAG: hypothetical protein KDA37_04855 [Planctomycetales bacterium]|nr:hypothetical protein [Planctomycetales bacterium]
MGLFNLSRLDRETKARVACVAARSGHSPDAILFVLAGLPAASPYVQGDVHIDGAELSWRLHDQALSIFGDEACDKLKAWGISSTRDFGQIVSALVEEGLMLRIETDTIEDFDDVFDFDREFRSYHTPPTKNRIQFNLATLLAITTITAIAAPGFVAQGFTGAIGALYGAWLSVAGGYCLWLGVRPKSSGRVIAIFFGAVLVVIGVVILTMCCQPDQQLGMPVGG